MLGLKDCCPMLCPGLRSISSITVPVPGDGMSTSWKRRRPAPVSTPSLTCAMLSSTVTCSPTRWYHFTKMASMGATTPFSKNPMFGPLNFPITARSESCMTSSMTSPCAKASWRLMMFPLFEAKISFSVPVSAFFTTAIGSPLLTGSLTSLLHLSKVHGPLSPSKLWPPLAAPCPALPQALCPGLPKPPCPVLPKAPCSALPKAPCLMLGPGPSWSTPAVNGSSGSRPEGQSVLPGVQQPASPGFTSNGGSLPTVARFSSAMLSSKSMPGLSPAKVAFTMPGLSAKMSTELPSGFSTVAIGSPVCTTSPGLT
mmetsp:Transcript_95751/g.222029  ORF Transcript_95751/g.222029 Transcript_95751/m.222029 type:complete len:312 (-) Transcript_95751:250-1185(-)